MKFFMSIVAMATATLGASLQEISNFGSNPSNIQMFIYVPDRLAPNPPIVVAMHYCGGSALSMFGYTALPSYSDRYGFILIYPQTTHDENCWDVYSSASLTRNGGGDSEGIVNMVKYTLSTFNGDASRVFMMGSSSGAMMTNVLAGVYPDVFQAGAAFSGVPCGCMFGDNGGNPTSSNQTCAQGDINWAAQQWADFAIHCDPGYSGSRPRLQMWHGTADELVSYKVLSQELEQWSMVLGVSFSHNVSGYPLSYYTKMVYGDGTKLQGYSGTGVQHPAPVQESPMLSFFGLLGGAATSTTPTPTTTPMTTPVGGGAGPTQTEWGQCGGSGWMGPTACANTLTCTTQNPYYAQCIPTAH